MKKLIGATLLIIILACGGGRSEMPTPMNKFILNPDLQPRIPAKDYTLILSDDNGNIFFYEKNVQFTDTIFIDVEVDKKLHLTYGIIEQDNFNIKTIKNITSGFSFSNVFFGECERESARQVELTIKNIEFPDKLYIGLGLANYSYDEPNKKLKITGFVRENRETLVSALLNQNSSYQSHLLSYSEWIEDNTSDLLTQELDFTQFYPATVKEIELDKEGVWDIRSEVLSDNSSKFLNAMEGSISNSTLFGARIDNKQQGTAVEIFTKPDLLSPQYNTEFWSQGYYEKIVGQLPEKLMLYDPFIEIIDPSPMNFQVNSSDNIDFSSIYFQLNTENFISIWTVVQVNQNGQDVKMITIPDEFLKNDPVIATGINNLRNTSFSAYKTNLENVVNIFQKREIFEELRCVSYSRKTVN